MAFTRFHILLRERIGEELNKWQVDLAHGSAKNHDEYRFAVGQIYGLEAALKLCEELERETDERG